MSRYFDDELYHHGILKQKWGVRNGPPYPLRGGDYSPAEKRAIYKERKLRKNTIYNKKHFDKIVSKGTEFATLSYDKERTAGKDMFYAAYTDRDKHLYNAQFNKKVPETIYDKDGNDIGTGNFYKYRIKNQATKDIKVASEDSGADAFMELYKRDRDFANFVRDPERLRGNYIKKRFKGYREAVAALERMDDPNYKPTEEDMRQVYRAWNYIIPADGAGNQRMAKDVATQRAKFFNELQNRGYSAVLDTNDAIYGGFKADAPVIVFDPTAVVMTDASRVTTDEKIFSDVANVGYKAIRASGF